MLPLDLSKSPDLVGRAPERAALAEMVPASARRGRAVLVTGPAGVGKSRLMAELRRMFREASRPVLEGRCRPTDYRPHGPLVDLLGAGAALLAELGRPHPRLTRALELMAGYGGGEGDEIDRALLFSEAVRQGLLEVSDVGAPLLCLHDLHRAHPGTESLVRYLLENLLTDPAFEWTPEADVADPAFRGLFAISFRDGPAHRTLLDAARASEIIDHLALAPLDADGVRAWLSADAVVGRLLAASQGLPSALEQLVEGLPTQVHDLWRERLVSRPAAERRVLEALAVLGVPSTEAELLDLAEVPDGRAQLARLTEAGMVARTLHRGLMRFRFRREAARTQTLEAMEPAARAALHRTLAERLTLSSRGASAEAIARHAIAGGAPAEAVPFALTAAAHLRTAGAFQRAARLLEAVVGAADGPLATEVWDRLAALYLEAGAVDRARNALAQLADLAPDRGGPALALRVARLNARAGDHRAAAEVAQEALARDPSPVVALHLEAVAAEAAYQLGDQDDAVARCTAALEGEPADPRAALLLRNTMGKVHLARESLDEAQALFTENLEVARGLKDPVQQARAQTNLGVVHLQRGEQDAAQAMFEATHALASEHGDLRHVALAVENLGVLYHRQMAFSLALRYYHQSTAAFRQLGNRRQLATTALNLADLYLVMGDASRAQRLAHIAGELTERDGLGHLEAQRLMLEGDLAREAGDREQAAARYAAVAALLDRGGSNQRLGPLRWAQAELALESGEPQRAAEALAEAQAQPGSESEAFTARLRMTRGAVLTATGDPEAAVQELEAAISYAEAAEDRETAWRALARLADAHWARADRAATLQALAAAVETIQRVAATLPAGLTQGYLEAPARQAVRDGLRRVRAGIAPRGPRENDAPSVLRRQVGEYQPRWASRYPSIIGRSPALFPVFNALDRVSGSDSMVLVRGESGTGKELVASALHAHSPRAQGPFVKVNCAAFVETLLLSELFGHEKGAFTGAVTSKKGRFELAHQGTLFLDEIGDISANTQVALLRVLQEGTFERVGGSQTIRVDVRLICATNRDLEAMVTAGTFRADLYYRLRGVILETPPLRDRPEDIPLLVEHFLERRRQAGRRLKVSRPAMASLLQHAWPGNVRELENVIRSVALFADGDRIGLAELAELGDIFRPPEEAALVQLANVEAYDVRIADSEPPASTPPSPVEPHPAGVFDEAWLERMLNEEGSLTGLKKRIELEAISRALRASEGNITQAAARLGMKRPRLSQIIHGTPALGALKREVTGQ